MEVTKSGKITIATFENYQAYQDNQSRMSQVNIALLKEFKPGEADFRYPTKVTFQLEVPDSLDDYLQLFSSAKRSSIKKRITDTEQISKLEVEKSITNSTFLKWDAGYSEFVKSIPFGEYKLDHDWFETKSQQHVGFFYYQDQEMIAGLMVKIFEKTKKASISYAWYNEDLRQSGGATHAFFEVLRYCIANDLQYCSFGQDTNLYGGHLPLGLHDYKANWPNIKVQSTSMSEIRGLIFRKLPTEVPAIVFYTLDEDNNLHKQLMTNAN